MKKATDSVKELTIDQRSGKMRELFDLLDGSMILTNSDTAAAAAGTYIEAYSRLLDKGVNPSAQEHPELEYLGKKVARMLINGELEVIVFGGQK
jgi:hypothetical protein